MDEPTTFVKENEWISRNPLRLTLLAFALALLWERLFYGRPIGISFPLWWAVTLLAGFAWASYENQQISKSAFFLTLPIVILTLFVPLRVEPLTTFLSISLSILLTLIWVRVLRPGKLLAWGWLDYLLAVVLVPLEGWLRPWKTLRAAQSDLTRGQSWSNRLLAVLRGLLLAIPIVILFLALLSAADVIFADWVAEAIEWLNLERLFDFFSRAFVTILIAVFLIGALVAALRRSSKEGLVKEGQPLFNPFLGMTEAGIVLGSVDLIFSIFVLVQFRYLFGGEANISATGYTYAEYARRGFGELVAVSFLTLGLILLLANWTKQKHRGSRRLFRTFSVLAVGLIGVMLVSAMVRLQLYERAYGFTRLRSYTHVAIILLGLLFIAFLLLLFLGELRRFAAVCLIGAIGFTCSLAIINVDRLIVERNFEHLQEIGELDGWYLTRLSDDAVPAIVKHLDQVPEEELPVISAGLACRHRLLTRRAERTGWPSYRLPHERARTALDSISQRLGDYSVEEKETYSKVKIGQDEYYYCLEFEFMR